MPAIFILLGLLMAQPENLPARVRAILAAPDYKTSEVEWTITWFGGWDDGHVERCVTKIAADTVLESNLGDERGFHYKEFRHQPSRGASDDEIKSLLIPREKQAGTRNKMLYDERVWSMRRAEKPTSGKAMPVTDTQSNFPVNMKAIGLAFEFYNEPSPPPFYLNPFDGQSFEKAIFREYWDRGFPAVAAEWDLKTLTWLFDDSQGGMPVQATMHRGDALAGYSQTKYQKIDERWFPKSVEFFDGSLQLIKRIDIQRASFDQPEHLQEITPVEFGALPGTQFGTPDGLYWWTGGELLHEDEYLPLLWLDPTIMDDRIAQSMVEGTGQTVEEYRARLRQSGDALRERYKREYGEELKVKKVDEEDPWVVYTNTFVKKHEFDEAAEKRARVTCDRAISLRDSLKLRDAAKIREARREGNKRKLDEIEEREKKVFERMLVKPLDKMLATLEKKKEASAKGG